VLEIDDLLLGHFEDLFMLWRAGTISLDMIQRMFGWYIRMTWGNGEIRKYITGKRDTAPRTYRGFDDLYQSVAESFP
jgi:hypothetical protein